MKIFFFLFSFFATISQSSFFCQKYSNEFLALGVGADAYGMGNAVVASTDGVSAAYWNPAGLVGVKSWLEASVMHSEFFIIIGTNIPGDLPGLHIECPEIKFPFQGIIDIIPMQLAASILAEKKGADPDNFLYCNFIVEKEGGL